jgi:hypothetical protein
MNADRSDAAAAKPLVQDDDAVATRVLSLVQRIVASRKKGGKILVHAPFVRDQARGQGNRQWFLANLQ